MRSRSRDGGQLLRAVTALAAGALLTVALPPAGLWPALLALTPLFVLTAEAAGFRPAFAAGFWFGLGFFSLYLLWLPASLGQPDWFGPLFWLAYPPLILLLASFWGLTTGLSRLAGGRGRTTLLLLPAAWLLTELLRHVGYFAFPWGSLGYMWLDTPVAQLADVVGVNGLSLLSAALAALVALPFVPAERTGRDRSLLAPLAALLLLGGAWYTGSFRTLELAEPEQTALLVQPNLDPFGRLGSPSGDLQVQLRLTADALNRLAAAPDLVVWPEGSLIGLNVEAANAAALRTDIQAAAPDSALLLGGRGESPAGGHNRAWLLQNGVITGSYDKNILVPFGETWPLIGTLPGLYRQVFSLLQVGMLQNTVAGTEQPALQVQAAEPFRIGVYICYESAFPAAAAAAVRAGAQVLVTITNDAWFARGNGARQHFDMGRMRAIETRRFVLRSSLNGITGSVDPNGEVVTELPRGVAATQLAGFTPSDVVTPYVRYGHLLWFVTGGWLLAGMAVRGVRYGFSD